MKRILFVGAHPLSGTGNGNMMAAVLSRVDTTKYEIACFAAGEMSLYSKHLFKSIPFTIIPARDGRDPWGMNRLISVLGTSGIDLVVMVGIDIWTYHPAFPSILKLRQQKGFKWAAIFPYDLISLRKDWVALIKAVDYPCVYSEYGYNMLKDSVPNIQYFRPPLFNADLFQPHDDKKRMQARHAQFPSLRDDRLLFGFVGRNQVRKDVPRLLKAMADARAENESIALYLHTEMFIGAEVSPGIHDLRKTAIDYGWKLGDLLAKIQGATYPIGSMVEIYNSLDCLINCTRQEGLSWTPLEAMLCGVPVVASDTTAQTELVKDAGALVPCRDLAYIPFEHHIESRACRPEDITSAVSKVAGDEDLRMDMREKGLKKAKAWLSGVSDINDVLMKATRKPAKSTRINKVLFAQHSSAGDVLMTTQCFRGIKERHGSMPLVYMTQPQFQDIVKGNPYVDEIIDWDARKAKGYEVVYNPHGEKILPGGFNNLDVKLYDMYPHFCKVEASDMFIREIQPAGVAMPDEYVVVHTTGGMEGYRTYSHMDLVLRGLDMPVAQIGGAADLPCRDVLDLRGKLSWRESAWVMAHARAAVVIDSFPAHLAGALGVPVVVLFGPAPARVTGPRGDTDKIICLEPNMLDVCPILSHCWGYPPPGKQKCKTPCINTILPIDVREALNSLLARSKKEG